MQLRSIASGMALGLAIICGGVEAAPITVAFSGVIDTAWSYELNHDLNNAIGTQFNGTFTYDPAGAMASSLDGDRKSLNSTFGCMAGSESSCLSSYGAGTPLILDYQINTAIGSFAPLLRSLKSEQSFVARDYSDEGQNPLRQSWQAYFQEAYFDYSSATGNDGEYSVRADMVTWFISLIDHATGALLVGDPTDFSSAPNYTAADGRYFMLDSRLDRFEECEVDSGLCTTVGYGAGSIKLTGTLTSFSSIEVPEPGTFALAMLVLPGLALSRKQRLRG